MKKDLDYYLGEITVGAVEDWDSGLPGWMNSWYYVETENSVVGVFQFERDALRFRLDYINQLLNGISI